MLRRRTDDTFEFRMVEAALPLALPAPLTFERREALLQRILAALGDQGEPVAQRRRRSRARWVAIPAGAGVAASIITATHYLGGSEPGADSSARVGSDAVLVDGPPGSDVHVGQVVEATGPTWIALSSTVRLGLESGAAVKYESAEEGQAVRLLGGNATVATTGDTVEVRGSGWSGTVGRGSAIRFSQVRGGTMVEAMEGSVLMAVNGTTYLVTPTTTPFYVPDVEPAREGGSGLPERAEGVANSVAAVPTARPIATTTPTATSTQSPATPGRSALASPAPLPSVSTVPVAPTVAAPGPTESGPGNSAAGAHSNGNGDGHGVGNGGSATTTPTSSPPSPEPTVGATLTSTPMNLPSNNGNAGGNGNGNGGGTGKAKGHSK